MSEGSPAARILHDARWMAGLTQAEVAQRAGVSRQVLSRYESGLHRPSVETLEKLLAGCGMRLRLSLVPEPGLEDEPTRVLLSLAPADRLEATWQKPLLALVRACPSPQTMLIGGKAGARIRGAALRVLELDVWFSDQLPIPAVAAILEAVGAVNPMEPEAGLPIFSFADLLNGTLLAIADAEVMVWRMPHFTGLLERAAPFAFRDEAFPDEAFPDERQDQSVMVMVAGPDDCAFGWYPRDRDHLALQRAVRISSEIPGPPAGDG